GKAKAPFLQALEEPNARAIFLEPKDRHHQLGHWVMQVQDNSRPHQLWNERAENKDIGHVVHVDQVVTLADSAVCERSSTKSQERAVLQDIGQFAIATSWDRNAAHAYAINGLAG